MQRRFAMKLRIRGNSLRLRLTQAEVKRVGAGEPVEDSVRFGPGDSARLVYAVAPSAEETGLRASFDGTQIRVTVFRDAAAAWASAEDVSLQATQPVGGGEVLSLLVEKDFACLKPRSGEDDSDAFPNPSAGR